MRKFQFGIILAALSLLIACGSSSSSNGDDNGDDNGGSTGETIDITGTLGTGTVSAMVTKSSDVAAGYTVVASNNATNRVYSATTGADGTFTLRVPSGTSILMGFLNDGSYQGPTVFDGSGSEVNTVITPSAAEDLGSITLDTLSGYARVTTASSSVNTSVTAVASDGVPLGAGNDGKTVNDDITTRSDSDEDLDGIPNQFDADDNNSGIRRGVATADGTSTVVSDYVESVYMTSNIWAVHGEISTGATQAVIAANEIAMRLHVIPVSGQESTLQSVQCTSVPASIASVAKVRLADSLGDPTDYPAEDSLWSAASYGLYETTTLTQEQWIISFKPVGVMGVGETFTIRVTYTDSSYEDFYLTLSYVLTDWAKITTYNGTTLTETVGTRDAAADVTSDTLAIVFAKPLDEDGVVLEGLSYSVIYGASDCSSGTCTVPTTSTETPVTDVAGSSTLTFSVPTTAVGTTYYVTPVAESADGQRNGEETWFSRK